MFAFCLVCNHLYCSKTSLDKTDSISSDLVFFLFDLNALLSYRLVQPRNQVLELTILNNYYFLILVGQYQDMVL